LFKPFSGSGRAGGESHAGLLQVVSATVLQQVSIPAIYSLLLMWRKLQHQELGNTFSILIKTLPLPFTPYLFLLNQMLF